MMKWIQYVMLFCGFSLLTSGANAQVKQDNISLPPAVLGKFHSNHPSAINMEWSCVGKGELIEHNLPDDYFKGRTTYEVDFNEGITLSSIWYDSAGNVMLTEKYIGIDSSNIPKRIRRYLGDSYYKYKIDKESIEEYSSLDGTWFYNIYVDNGSHEEPQELFFDSASIYIASNGIQPPNAISGIFEAKYPDAEILNWGYSNYFKTNSPSCIYLMRFVWHNKLLNSYFDTIGTPLGESIEGIYVPYQIRAKADSLFPQYEKGNWSRGCYYKYGIEEIDSNYFSVAFADTINHSEYSFRNFITFDTMANVVEIGHAINPDSLPSNGLKYIKKHYKSYSIMFITAMDGINGRTYIASVIKENCTGNCGYSIFLNKRGKYLKKSVLTSKEAKL